MGSSEAVIDLRLFFSETLQHLGWYHHQKMVLSEYGLFSHAVVSTRSVGTLPA